MKTVDLQIRIARKMASGRGAMQITQADLDVLVESGAYAAICNAATEELKEHRAMSVDSKSSVPQPVPKSVRGFDMTDEVTVAWARAEGALKRQERPLSTATVLRDLIKSGERK